MDARIAELEARLDHFDRAERQQALEDLAKLADAGQVRLPEAKARVNLHVHSFFSYNALGYSPSHIVWRARREGLWAVGLVDFDVFDGVDEFLQAGERLGIRAVAGMETRVSVPEFATREITSPGEPGITYHMVTGVTRSAIDDPWARAFAAMLRSSARRRNEAVMAAVNAFLAPAGIDYEADVMPLAPAGTPTERHLCVAYEKKAEAVFPDRDARVRFWAEKLAAPPEKVAGLLGQGAAIQNLLRAKTMKQGGVGYQKPTSNTFPRLADVNRFALAVGGIPTITWLDGTSRGEQDIEELLGLQMRLGGAALNIVPDRNWNLADPKVKEAKLRSLYRIVELAGARHLPLCIGTELNAPGQKFVDDFDAPELAPVVASFLRGAAILCGHTAAVLAGEHGYCSRRAALGFATVVEKNDHFAQRGREWRGG